MTSMCVCKVTSVLSDRLPCPWDSPGKNTGVGCHFLLQGIFLTQGSNPGLLCLLQWQVGSLAPVAPGEPPQRQPDESKNYPRSLAPQSFPKVLKEERKKQNKTYLISRRRKWQPTPGSLPENSVDQEPGGVQSISVQSLRRVWVLWPHGLQHTRPPCPSPTPRAYSKSCPSCQWCHPTISFSVAPFFPCSQSFPASGSFPISLLFGSGGQSIEA